MKNIDCFSIIVSICSLLAILYVGCNFTDSGFSIVVLFSFSFL